MRGFAATVTAKELAKALAPHKVRKSDRDVQGASNDRLPDPDNADDLAGDGKHEEPR